MPLLGPQCLLVLVFNMVTCHFESIWLSRRFLQFKMHWDFGKCFQFVLEGCMCQSITSKVPNPCIGGCNGCGLFSVLDARRSGR